MSKEILSGITIRFTRTRIAALALTLVSTVSLAHAQTDKLGDGPQKQEVPKIEVAKVAESGNEDNSASKPIVAKPESVAQGFSTPAVETKANNPFAKARTEKTYLPLQQSSGSEWQFAFAPYLYMTGVTGTIGARGRLAEIDMDFTDVVENLNLGIMGAFEARKGRFVLVNDLMWIKLGEERDTPGGLYSSAKLGVNMFVWDPEAGYRVYEGKAGSFDILGGFRLMSVENNVNFRAGTLPAFDVSERKTWATPVIGAHGTLNLSPKFFLATKFDIGGGLGADFTGQFYGGGGYRLTPKIALVGGYRYLRTDYDSEAGFIFDTTMNGVLLGAKFAF